MIDCEMLRQTPNFRIEGWRNDLFWGSWKRRFDLILKGAAVVVLYCQALSQWLRGALLLLAIVNVQ